jgi:hypothetical protein
LSCCHPRPSWGSPPKRIAPSVLTAWQIQQSCTCNRTWRPKRLWDVEAPTFL